MDADRWQRIPPMTFASFFSFALPIRRASSFSDLHSKSYLLPPLGGYVGQDEFAKVSVGWNDEGLLFQMKIETKLREAMGEDELLAHRVEVMVDTRDRKDISYPTKYCHHFVFYPGAILPSEITRFRGEESRKLADPKELKLHVEHGKSFHTMRIEIGASALYGFDPAQEKRLGLCYKIHRPEAPMQTLLVSPEEYCIERVPSLWTSCCLEEYHS